MLGNRDKHHSGSFSCPGSLIQLKTISPVSSPGVFSTGYAQEN